MLTFAHTEKDSGQSVAHSRSWEGVGRIGLVSVQSVRIVGEMKSWFPVYFQGPVTYHDMAKWTEGTWAELLVSPAHLSLPPNPMQDNLDQRLVRARSWSSGFPWLPEEPDGTVCSGDFSPDG